MRQTSRFRTVVLSFLAAGCSAPPLATIITVKGTVLNTSGAPVLGANVLINGAPVVTTAADGTFTVSNVAVPYRALVGVTGANPAALLFVGLTRADPVLAFPNLATPPGFQTATAVSGTVSGGGAGTPPWPAGATATVSFGSIQTHPFPGGNTTVNGTVNPATWSLGSVSWFGGATTSGGILHALQWDKDVNNLPVTNGYLAYGNLSLDLTNLGSFTGENIPLSTSGVSTTTVSGTVVLNGGYTLSNRRLSVLFPPTTAQVPLATESASPPAAFSYFVPSINGVTTNFALTVSAANGGAASVLRQCIAPGTSASVSVPLASVLATPANAATGVGPGTPFSWSASLNGINLVSLSGPSGSPSLTVFTTDTTFSLPDLTPVGLAWPAATSYSWGVTALAPETIDDFASSLGWLDFLVAVFGAFPGCNGSATGSLSSTFTTP